MDTGDLNAKRISDQTGLMLNKLKRLARQRRKRIISKQRRQLEKKKVKP